MLLVVGSEDVPADHLASLDHDVSIVTSVGEARRRCRRDPVDAVVLDCDLGDTEVAWFVWDLRNDDLDLPRIPVVAVGDEPVSGPTADERVPTPVERCELRAAVERAVRLGEYEEALHQLFSACRRGIGRRSRDLGTVRERADECLRAVDACDERLPFERLIDA